VARLGRAELVAFKDRWLRPDNLEIFVVSDVPLAQMQQMLEQRFGTWAPPRVDKGKKSFAGKIPAAKPRVVLIDRPGSPQSVIYGGLVTPFRGTDDLVDLTSANDILGGNFLSRINMDLRETKGWSYGVRGTVQRAVEAVPYLISRRSRPTGPATRWPALMDNVREFTSKRGVSEAELSRTIANNFRSLPGQLRDLARGAERDPDQRALQAPGRLLRAAGDHLPGPDRGQARRGRAPRDPPENFVWVVVGEAAKVQPQLAKLGLPVELRAAEPDAAPGAPPKAR
jgi:predicted Zn-dependent peptidase